jgi:hypothetical protein
MDKIDCQKQKDIENKTMKDKTIPEKKEVVKKETYESKTTDNPTETLQITEKCIKKMDEKYSDIYLGVNYII